MKNPIFEILEFSINSDGITRSFELVADDLTVYNAFEVFYNWKKEYPDSLICLAEKSDWRNLFDLVM